jgi:hypothetical protein
MQSNGSAADGGSPTLKFAEQTTTMQTENKSRES